VLLPCVSNIKTIKKYIKSIDGLLISGAADLHPALYNERILPQTKSTLPLKQEFDMELVQTAWDRRIPVLAICYGAQLLNIYLGGTLFQDITTQLKLKSHRNKTHTVYISEESTLYRILGKSDVVTNSFHHQAIKTLGRGLVISAKASDGIIEAVEAEDRRRFVIGVQWHPERMTDKQEMKKIFSDFIRTAKR